MSTTNGSFKKLSLVIITLVILIASLGISAQPASAATCTQFHTVKKGETLLSIGRKLGVSRADLADANYLSARAKLAIGQRLIIPRAPSLVLASRTDTPPPALETEPAAEVLAATNTAPGATATTPASVTYRVKRGDTLFAIAKLYRTTVASLKTWNRLRSNSIQVGQRLTIFTRTTAAATS